MRPLTVLFVCTGNTCRSPLAEAFARERLGDRVRVLSAGLQAADGQAASEGSRQAAAAWGIDLSGHRSRPLTPELLAEVDWVIVMTRTQARLLRQRFPGLRARLGLLGAPGRDLVEPVPPAANAGTGRNGGNGSPRAPVAVPDPGLDEETMSQAEEVSDPFGHGPLEYGAMAAQLDRLLRRWAEFLLGETGEGRQA